MTELGLPLPRAAKSQKGDESPAAGKASELPDSFERESSKFWLQRGQVIPFVDLVTQRLGPYKFQEQKDAFNVITSIYLDNDTFDLYASRVARQDGAQLVRFRWYTALVIAFSVCRLTCVCVQVQRVLGQARDTGYFCGVCGGEDAPGKVHGREEQEGAIRRSVEPNE